MKYRLTALAGLAALGRTSPTRLSSPRPFELIDHGKVEQRADTHDCPGYLNGNFVCPDSIYPISKSHPTMHYPTTYSPVITPDDYCTIFNFYIPPEAAGKTCALEFLFPELDQLEESTFTYSGGGHFTFSGYVGYGATNETTWNNQPSPGNSLYNPPPQILTPGHRYALNKPYPGSCIITKGMPALEIGGKLCSNDTIFTYFQDDSLCPIGLYVQYY